MRHARKRNLRLVGALAVVGGLVTAGTVVSGAFADEAPGTLPSKQEWLRQVSVALEPAQEFLDERLRNGDEDVAIVLDIDNTSLGTDLDDQKPMKDTLELARSARDKGALVMFVTNRKESGRKKTTAQLKDAGFPVDGLCMRQSDDDASKTETKTNCRISIEKEGHTIVANIGNRSTDLEGGHAERTFKLPDFDGQLQ